MAETTTGGTMDIDIKLTQNQKIFLTVGKLETSLTEAEFYALLDAANNIEAELNWDNSSISDFEGVNYEI